MRIDIKAGDFMEVQSMFSMETKHIQITSPLMSLVCDESERDYIAILCNVTNVPMPVMYAVRHLSMQYSPHDVTIPLDFIKRNLRLLLLADHVIPLRREGFMDQLTDLLEKCK